MPSEDERSSNLLYFMGFHFGCITVSISSRHKSMINKQSNLNQNGILGHLLLSLSH